jgi:bacterioferritin (cytochrome b1)
MQGAGRVPGRIVSPEGREIVRTTDPRGRRPNMSNQELIDGLTEQLNREVSTFLRSMFQAAFIRGAEFDPIRDMYLQEVPDEVEHAQYLANQIRLMEGRAADEGAIGQDMRRLMG